MLKIFISYSHTDKLYKDKIRRALHPLVLNNTLKIWEDGELIPGALYNKEIKQHLNDSDIIIYLLSIDFFCSEYILEHEYTPVIEKWKRGEVRLVGVLVTNCAFQSTDFGQIHLLPSAAKPLNLWEPIETGLIDVVRGINKVIQDVVTKR